MTNSRENAGENPRTIHYMITRSLGYCCEWAFFSQYKRTALIATRLGVTPRAVRYHKAAAGEGCCEGRECCLKKRLAALQRSGK